MTDQLIEALKAEWDDQPDDPEFTVGQAVNGSTRFLGVDRVATPDGHGGMECGRTLTGRRFMIAFPDDLTRWVVASLGAYLSDDEWEQAADDRLDEIGMRGDA